MNHPYALAGALRRPVSEALALALKAKFGDRFSTSVSYTHLTLPTKA